MAVEGVVGSRLGKNILGDIVHELLIELIRVMPGNGWMILMAMKGGGGGKLYCRSGEEGNKQCAR